MKDDDNPFHEAPLDANSLFAPLAPEPAMKEIHSRTWTNDDGTECTITIKTSEGQPISEEDQEYIRRFLPLAAGEVLNVAAPEPED